jgi:uncharacterized SAM-binding protein YcdF (DUF218 family)
MFLVSKLIGFVLLPSNFIGIVGALGLLSLLLRRVRLGRALLALAALLLIVAGWSPLGSFALTLLEDRFPQPSLSGPVAGIVMLGGGVDTHITTERGLPALNDAGERITAVGDLARRFPEARLVLSGGASHLAASEPVTESAIAADVLVGFGVPRQRIELEERSRNTCENATESVLVARPQPGETWLLVTSASHMPRAVACFRAAGFAIVPYPVDYRVREIGRLGLPRVSMAHGLEALDLAAHEWVGLAGYRLVGRTSEFFPAP